MIEPSTNSLLHTQDIVIKRQPHMPKQAISFLRERMRISKCYLEYGSGGSTRMAVRESIPHIFSVESDLAFARAVKKHVKRDMKDSQFHMISAGIGRTGAWGIPEDNSKVDAWPKYATSVWNLLEAQGLMPDLILIDGRFRAACMLASLIKSAPGTFIIFDDYLGRKSRYDVVERYAKPIEFKDRTAIFMTPSDIDVRNIAFDLATYCVDPR